jgi:hypothetical protein
MLKPRKYGGNIYPEAGTALASNPTRSPETLIRFGMTTQEVEQLLGPFHAVDGGIEFTDFDYTYLGLRVTFDLERRVVAIHSHGKWHIREPTFFQRVERWLIGQWRRLAGEY